MEIKKWATFAFLSTISRCLVSPVGRPNGRRHLAASRPMFKPPTGLSSTYVQRASRRHLAASRPNNPATYRTFEYVRPTSVPAPPRSQSDKQSRHLPDFLSKYAYSNPPSTRITLEKNYANTRTRIPPVLDCHNTVLGKPSPPSPSTPHKSGRAQAVLSPPTDRGETRS